MTLRLHAAQALLLGPERGNFSIPDAETLAKRRWCRRREHSLHEIAIAAHDRHREYVLARINHGGPYSDLRLAGEILC